MSYANSLARLNDIDEANFDIVAVHGLNTLGKRDHALHTWTAKNGKVWLRDFLPVTLQTHIQDAPDTSARIFNYQYNSNVVFETSQAGVTGAAETLLNLLHLNRENVGERAIVFIGHSLGGLVIKQALCHAKINDKYANIKRCTKLLIFMGTPHYGGNNITLGKIAARIATISPAKSSNDILASLSQNSLLSKERSNLFRHQLEDYYIISFYETLSYNFKGKHIGCIVDKESAVLGLPGSREEIIPLEADHAGLCKFESDRDPLYIQVVGNIKSMMQKIVVERVASERRNCAEQSKFKDCSALNSSIQTGNVHWVMRRAGNPLFTGQQALIKQLEAALLPSKDAGEPRSRALFVLSGMGGVGKSEVAVQFAQSSRNRFWGIFWIDCSRVESIQSSFQQVASALEIKSNNPDLAISSVKDFLATSTFTWLLILDNCDNPDLDYGTYLPSGLRGAILLTSRLLECERHATPSNKFNLTGLAMQEASDLVLKAANVETPQWKEKRPAAESISEKLGRHPLAITLAGSYIRDRLCSLEEYSDVFEKQTARMLHHSQVQASADYATVYATFEISMQHLERSHSESRTLALRLLRVAAYMNRQGIEEDIFHRAWAYYAGFSGDDREVLENSIRELTSMHLVWSSLFIEKETVAEHLEAFRAARATLWKLSLAQFDEDPNSFSLHPLVHAWARERLSKVERADGWIAIASILALSTLESRTQVSYSFSLQRHLETCLERCEQFSWRTVPEDLVYDILRILYCCIYQLFAVRSKKAYRWSYMLLNASASHPLVSEISQIQIKLLHGRSLMVERHDRLAVEVLEEVANFQVASTADDPWLSLRKTTLAEAYIQSREYLKAVQLLEDVVEIGCWNSPKSLDRLIPERELGIAYLCSGRIWDAMDVLETVTTHFSNHHPRSDPDLLKAWVWLAYAYLKSDQNGLGIEILEEAIEIMEKTHPIDHPNLLGARTMLAKAYLAGGRIAEATDIAEDVVKTNSATHCRRHPQLLGSRIDLAGVYMKSKQNMASGLMVLGDVLEIEREYLRPGHLRLLAAEQQLADAYCTVGQYDKAAGSLENALEAYRAEQRSQHPDYIACRKRLANVYAHQKRNSTDTELEQDMEQAKQSARSVQKDQRTRRSILKERFARSNSSTRPKTTALPRHWPGTSGMVLAHIYTRKQRELMREGYAIDWVPQGDPRTSEAWKFYKLAIASRV